MRIWLKWIGAVALLGFAALQFTTPPHINPSVLPGHDALASNAPPPAITALLKNACYDCHSYETTWPWYSYIAPISWTVVQDVNDARDSMNFSEWPHDDPHRARKRWRRIAEAVDANEMPISKYMMIHRKSRLTAAQRKQLVAWAQQEAEKTEDQ
ncbi:MAG TPA: heme-binding domain-containing protein [Verrucomicrobiae bacterium]|jgi:hypothetical protein|nr:heme-binding domain-containing protein [Verrucomicrobiae bacterium]